MIYQGINVKKPPMNARATIHGEKPSPMANAMQRTAKERAFIVRAAVMEATIGI